MLVPHPLLWTDMLRGGIEFADGAICCAYFGVSWLGNGDKSMDFSFNRFKLVAVSVLMINSISSDGWSNWLEGTLLLSCVCGVRASA